MMAAAKCRNVKINRCCYRIACVRKRFIATDVPPPPPPAKKPDLLAQYDIYGGEADPTRMRITAFGDNGFEFSGPTGTETVEAPICLLPKLAFEWNVSKSADITLESLRAVILHSPQIDILLIGTGGKQTPISPQILEELARKRVGVEVMSTANACGTFNILNQEERRVAACLLTLEQS